MRRIVAVCAVLALLLLACGGSQPATETTAGPTATTELPSTTSTVPPPTTTTDVPASATTTEPQVATFEVSPETGLVGTVFYASGSGCSGEAYISVILADVPSGPNDFTIEGHPVPTVGGEWTEELDSAGWPHWVPGSDPPQYEGLGSNPGLYRVSAKCMVGEGFGEVLFDYTDQFFTIEPDGTQPPSKVTTGENIPEALSRDLIPWAEVGPGWYLVGYGAWSPESPDLRRPTVLYLVDGRDTGVLYEVAAFPWNHGGWLADWRSDGSAALVWTTDPVARDFTLSLLDIATGEQQVLVGDHLFDHLGGPNFELAFTKPQGLHLVASTDDGATEKLAYYDIAGNRLQELYSQPIPDGTLDLGLLSWLYGLEGLDAVVGHSTGIALVDNRGDLIRELWVPEDNFCKPVRWWSEGEFLARCTSSTRMTSDSPDAYLRLYWQPWVLRTDGAIGEPITTIPQGELPYGVYGHYDAWPTAAGVLLQGSGECATGTVHILEGGQTRGFPTVLPGVLSLVDVVDGRVALKAFPECGGQNGAFYIHDLQTGEANIIIPPIEDIVGVQGVIGLATVNR